MTLGKLIASISLVLASTVAFAHSDDHDKHKTEIDYSKVEHHSFGKAADPDKAARSIAVEMSDAMKFTPANIEVQAGEVVRFEIRNNGKLLHEMVLGSMDDLNHHAALMKKFPGMEHDEPHMAHIQPGKAGEMGWVFTDAGEYHFGCLVPGHFDAGMRGTITVR